MWHTALSSLEQHQAVHHPAQWLHLAQRSAQSCSVITRVRTWVGANRQHCHHPLLWWKTLSTIPFAAALIYAANTPFSIPRSKLSLLAVPQALPLYFLSPGCIFFSHPRLFSWSLSFFYSAIFLCTLFHPVLYPFFKISLYIFSLFSHFKLLPLPVFSTPVTFLLALLCNRINQLLW